VLVYVAKAKFFLLPDEKCVCFERGEVGGGGAELLDAIGNGVPLVAMGSARFCFSNFERNKLVFRGC